MGAGCRPIRPRIPREVLQLEDPSTPVVGDDLDVYAEATEALYRAVPDLNQATGDLPALVPVVQPSGSGS